MSNRKIAKRRGRPLAGRSGDAKSALLEAARSLFATRSFRTVTVRELAAAADVNPAMVNYHFGGKHGMYETMVAQTVGPILAQLEQAAEGGGDLTLDGFLARYQQTLIENPWLPNLVVREVLYSDGLFHHSFIEQFGARAGTALMMLIERERGAGALRSDLDPRMAALSLLSLTVFPLIARPLLEPALGLDMEEGFFPQLAQHNRRLFHHGANSTAPKDADQ